MLPKIRSVMPMMLLRTKPERLTKLVRTKPERLTKLVKKE